MKALLTFFLVFISLQSQAQAGGAVYSRVCSYNQVQGVQIKDPSGMLLNACLNPRMLGDEYETSLDGYCHAGFVEGIIVESTSGGLAKLCLRGSTLGEVYETSAAHSCAFGYGADEAYRGTGSTKYCVKGRTNR